MVLKKYALLCAVIAGSIQMNSCTSYYLQKIQSQINIPDAAPIPVAERNSGDTRVTMGFTGTNNNRIHFNDGNHSKEKDTVRNRVTEHAFSGDNISLETPDVQGMFGIDFTIAKHFYFFSKADLGILDDRYFGSGNLGIGLHFSGQSIAFQNYFSVNANKLRSYAQVLEEYDNFDSTYDSLHEYEQTSYNLGVGGGFQFITVNDRNIPHFTFGIDLLLQKYFVLRNNSNEEYHEDKNRNYKILFITPGIGLLQNFKNHQITFLVRYSFITLPGNNNDNTVPVDQGIPSLSLTWTYCFGGKQNVSENQ